MFLRVHALDDYRVYAMEASNLTVFVDMVFFTNSNTRATLQTFAPGEAKIRV